MSDAIEYGRTKEGFRYCTLCGCLVSDIVAHREFHDALSSVRAAVSSAAPKPHDAEDDYHAWQRRNEAPTVYSDPEPPAVRPERPTPVMGVLSKPGAGSEKNDIPVEFNDAESSITYCTDPWHSVPSPERTET